MTSFFIASFYSENYLRLLLFIDFEKPLLA